MTALSTRFFNIRNPWLVMPALVLVVYGTFLAAQWSLAGNHLYGFISFNHKRVDPAESVIPGEFVSHQFGYDGQFYYRLALDPFSGEEEVQGLSIDHPPWRQQRILLPVMTWLIARGDPELTATVMMTINLLAVAGLTLVGGALLRSHGLSPWSALLLAFYPGFAISIERFLSEPVSFLLLLLSLLCLQHKKIAWGGVVLALAMLARETALAAALAMAGIWFLQSVLRLRFDRWSAPGPAFWAPAIAAYVIWQAWLMNHWTTSAYSAAEKGNLLVLPFTGIAASFLELVNQLNVSNMFFLAMMFYVVSWAVIIALLFRQSQGPYRWLWLAYLLLATLLGTAIWNNSPGFLRITTELNLLGMLVYLLAVRKPRRIVLVIWVGCWLLTAGSEAYRLHLIDQARDSFEVATTKPAFIVPGN